jgi:hypothetical protein
MDIDGAKVRGLLVLEQDGAITTIDLATGAVLGEGAGFAVRSYMAEVMLDATADGTPYHLLVAVDGETSDARGLVTCLRAELANATTAVRGTAPISEACPAASVEVVYTQPAGSGAD